MKAKVDQTGCIGCGLCEIVCPSVFKMNDEGIAEAIAGEINSSDIESVNEAMEQCPVEVITIK